MSKDQLTDQQVEVGAEAQGAPAAEQSHGLPSHVFAQVTVLGPADAPALADLLTLYPGLSSRILAAAAPQVGNAAVQRAIAIADGRHKVQGKPGSMNQGEMREMLGESAPAAKTQGKPGSLSQAEMHELLDDAPAPAAKTQGKPGSLSQAEMHELLDDAPARSTEPAWVAGARVYNSAHAEYVADFNELTQNSCLGADGKVDPQAVARWQKANGLDADGKIGPHTVASARKASSKASSGGPAPAASDARPPV
jgi:peptidoglycan hydrolase-like protein with peptidoglycan-binding domain